MPQHIIKRVISNLKVFKKAPLLAFRTDGQTLANFFPHCVEKVALRAEYGRGGAPGLLLIGIGTDFGVVEIRGPPSLVSSIIV